MAENIGSPWLVALASANFASLVAGLDIEATRDSAERAHRIAQHLGNPSIGAFASYSQAIIAFAERRFEDALRWNEDARALAERAAIVSWEALAVCTTR
jgi:hypothetical protein